MDHFFLNRTLCDVLRDMRSLHETRNYSALLSLIEEAQVMANRMEAAIGDKNDVQRMNDEWHELKNKLKELRKEVKDAGGDDGK